MFYLACTRFNDATYDENVDYRTKHNEMVIYGSMLKIRDIYSLGSLLFVAEMNNEKNRIEGIGLIKNLLVNDKRHRIYRSNCEYNRYIYRGKYWISRDHLNSLDPQILEIFDNILFKGKSHLKRRIGITVITERLFIHWDYELTKLKNMVKEAFIKHFRNVMDEPLVYNEAQVSENITTKEENNEYFDIIPKHRKHKYLAK